MVLPYQDVVRQERAGVGRRTTHRLSLLGIDDGEFVEEFQLRTEFPEKVMQDIGSIGYAVGIFEQGKGYGKAVLRLGLELAKQHGMRGATFAETALGNPMITKLPYKT